jgi:hypothetical protein
MRWITQRSASVVRGTFCGLGLEAVERRLGQAHRQLVDAIDSGMQLLDRRKYEGRNARARERRNARRSDLGGNGAVLDL